MRHNLQFSCAIFLLAGRLMKETSSQCTWTSFADLSHPYGGIGLGSGASIYQDLENKINSMNGLFADPIEGAITDLSLPNTVDVFFAVPSDGKSFNDDQKSVLQDWINAGNTLILVGAADEYSTGFNNMASAVGDVVCNGPLYELNNPGPISTISGMDSHDLALANPMDNNRYWCDLISNEDHVKTILTKGSDEDVVLSVLDPTTGFPYNGRVIYIGSNMLWSDYEKSIRDEADPDFLTRLVNFACSDVSAPDANDPIFDRDWQIVLHPEDDIQSNLVSDGNDDAADLSVTQKFYSTGQEHVRYRLFQEDCETALPDGVVSTSPTISTSDDETSTTTTAATLLTGTFHLDVAVLVAGETNAIWTGSETSGTARLCTIIELLSEEESSPTSESMYMLESLITLTIDLVAQIVSVEAMDVNAIANRVDKSSSNVVVGDVEACQCNHDSYTCYDDTNTAPALRQGSFLHICLTYPDGFDTGTIRSMDISQPNRVVSGDEVPPIVTIIDSDGTIKRSGLTSVNPTPEGAPTDLVIKTMIPTQFFRYNVGEDRSMALPPLVVLGEISLGISSTNNDRLLLVRRRHHHNRDLLNDKKKERSHHDSLLPIEDDGYDTKLGFFTMQVNLEAVEEVDSYSIELDGSSSSYSVFTESVIYWNMVVASLVISSVVVVLAIL